LAVTRLNVPKGTHISSYFEERARGRLFVMDYLHEILLSFMSRGWLLIDYRLHLKQLQKFFVSQKG